TIQMHTPSLHDALPILDAQLQKVRAHEAAAAEKVTDNDVANLGARIDELNKKIDEKNNAADAAQALKGGPIDPLAGTKIDDKERSEEHTSELQSPCNLV